MTTDLVTWLREQLDEDERVARTGFTHPDRWVRVPPGIPTGLSCTAVLAEVDAKRRILDAYAVAEDEDARSRGDGGQRRYGWAIDYPHAAEVTGLRIAVRLLAVPYSDREGYDESWRPA